MPPGAILSPPRQRRRSRRRRRGSPPSPARCLGLYLLACGACFGGTLLILASGRAESLGLLAALHCGAGYGLNRTLLARLPWNPNFATLAVVAETKLKALMFWPVVYPVLILQLALARYL